MTEKYSKKRPSIPAPIKRSVEMESGHACAVTHCNEHSYNEHHHIDGNRENNDPSNIIFLCDKHHKMAHAGKIDKTALREYKKINGTKFHSPNTSALISHDDEKRKRDIESIVWVLSTIHFPTLDDHIEGLPKVVTCRVFHFWESFKGVVQNSLFHLYDSELESILYELYSAWNASLSFGSNYVAADGGANIYVFRILQNGSLHDEHEKEWRSIAQAAQDIDRQKNRLLSYLRDEYIEVDINGCNQKAWKSYLSYYEDK